ncbi:MAG: hypothetical protein ACRC50_03105 [Gaiella sp.]
MIPWLILALVAIPLVVVGFVAVRRRSAVAEHPLAEDDATRARTERSFAEAEAYEEQWRQEHRDDPRERLP